MALRVGRSRLPELLKAKGYSQSEFARLLGVSRAFISQVIKGEKYFSYPLGINAAFLLDCPMEELHEIIYIGNR